MGYIELEVKDYIAIVTLNNPRFNIMTREMMKEFVPAGKNWRVDPYDNQCGEAEYEDWRVPGDKFNYKYTDLGIWQI